MAQRQYRIVFMDGTFFDFMPPAEFHFPTWITTCRSVGMWLWDEIYVRFDMVRCVVPWSDGSPPPGVAKPPNAPTTETKQ